MAFSFLGFLDHTQRRTTLGTTPLNERLARCRDLYMTTHNIYKRQDIHTTGGIRTHNLSRRAAADLALNRAATGTGFMSKWTNKIILVRRDRMFLIPTLKKKKKAKHRSKCTHRKTTFVRSFLNNDLESAKFNGHTMCGPSLCTTSVLKSFHCNKYLGTGGMRSTPKRV